MSIEEKLLSSVFLMLASGEKITVYSLASRMDVDRSSIYYRIKKELSKQAC
ncbi:MAG: hypothetical protein RQ763_07925 [Sulfurimonas sp.]|uniref:hypothetical protein n=1 Tax=Sulfurimonas sp. TaxID=2022749 RepID=UPI0028CE9AE3|nr:hypothetical protein [Sulfurimonas sp.]MDT8339112.1 hypothetical protein [Sulfurimonas sp.]